MQSVTCAIIALEYYTDSSLSALCFVSPVRYLHSLLLTADQTEVQVQGIAAPGPEGVLTFSIYIVPGAFDTFQLDG
jgi:hypothetical protein